jgi:hypothetical protein
MHLRSHSYTQVNVVDEDDIASTHTGLVPIDAIEIIQHLTTSSSSLAAYRLNQASTLSKL